ncbi:MAG: 50S ribosomal protein L9 [Phycisphaerales bacterium]
MAKTIQLLLTSTVEPLGIVGDVVAVKPGYARNFLLPRELATTPSEEKIAELAQARAEAQKERELRRQQREEMVGKLEGFEITLTRACNDQGLLYGSVSQQDIADALAEEGYEVRPRDVRLPHAIKRIDSYEIPVKPESDLEATIKLWVVADRELDLGHDESPDMEFDEEGELIEPSERQPMAEDAGKGEAEAEKAEG